MATTVVAFMLLHLQALFLPHCTTANRVQSQYIHLHNYVYTLER